LKTAAEVLRALCIVGDTAGVTARELGERLGKSTVTARYLLNTLHQEGFVHRESRGVYRLCPTPPWEGCWGPVPLSQPSVEAPGQVQNVPVPRRC
jgi:predicted transcriptional regulator of viral defense system